MEEQTKSRTERKKDKMRRQIVEIAMDLFHKQGFSATTMEQIAGEVDIAKKTLYNYFPEKEAILTVYMQGVVTEGENNLDQIIAAYPDIHACLLAVFEKAAEQAQADREIYQVYVAYRIQHSFNPKKELRSGLEAFLVKILENAQAAGQIRQDLPAKYLAQQLELSYGMTLVAWLADFANVSFTENISRCLDLFLQGAAAR